MSCCVGMCCGESSWLGVRRMLRNEGYGNANEQYGLTKCAKLSI